MVKENQDSQTRSKRDGQEGQTQIKSDGQDSDKALKRNPQNRHRSAIAKRNESFGADAVYNSAPQKKIRQTDQEKVNGRLKEYKKSGRDDLDKCGTCGAMGHSPEVCSKKNEQYMPTKKRHLQAKKKIEENKGDRHKDTHGSSTCPKCTETFPGKNLIQHMINCSYKNCSYCNEYYPAELLNDHQQFCHMVSCPRCTERIRDINLEQHFINCSYKSCRHCFEYYPGELLNDHQQFCQVNSNCKNYKDYVQYTHQPQQQRFQKNADVKAGEEEKCIICLLDFENNEEVRKYTCNHVFHPMCIDSWLVNNSNCPICKRDMKN